MNAYLYVFDTLADWEIGFITAELNSGRYFASKGETVSVITIADDCVPVTTMGGMSITPKQKISDTDFSRSDILILPGGNTWMEPVHTPILDVVSRYAGTDLVIAAICGATIALAERGILNTRKHTSNNLDYLKAVCPHYTGSGLYVHEPAVIDANVITASGIAPIEFAYKILEKTERLKKETLDAWYNLYKYKEEKHFFSLIESLK